MTVPLNVLRAPDEPRDDEPQIPGFGLCSHPEHGSYVWLVEGELVDGKPVGRCSKHSHEGGTDGRRQVR